MKDFPKDLFEMAKAVSGEFATLRDRVRVKSHLFKMETEDALERLDRQLSRAEQGVSRFLDAAHTTSDQARVQANLALMEAKDRYAELRESMEEVVDKLEAGSKSKIDEARLKGHLTRMEAEDYWEKKSKDWSKKLATSGDQGAEEIKRGLTSLSSGIKSLLGRLPPE